MDPNNIILNERNYKTKKDMLCDSSDWDVKLGYACGEAERSLPEDGTVEC